LGVFKNKQKGKQMNQIETHRKVTNKDSFNNWTAKIRDNVEHGFAVRFEIQPGDATRYDIVIVPVLDQNQNAAFLYGLANNDRFNLRCFHDFSPTGLWDFEDEPNPVTRHLLAEIWNQITNTETKKWRFYNLERLAETGSYNSPDVLLYQID